jgi:AcrR family transcriptional regulator
MPSSRHRSVRRPVQARAVRRREALLDATARVLDRAGYDALTTNAVASEAGTAIGTVYEYFDDREALLSALLARHAERLGVAIERAMARGGTNLVATVDAVVEAFARILRAEPGYRASWSAAQLSTLLLRTGETWSHAFTSHIAEALRAAAPTLTMREAKLIGRTAVHLVSGILLAAMSGARQTERKLIAETKVALQSYLVARLPTRARPRRRSER